ncbi:MAG: transglutaminase-like domain-containing protein [Lachnospirales bacterium]
MNKIIFFGFVLALTLSTASSVYAGVDTTNSDSGYITVTASGASKMKPYVTQVKNSGQTYNYTITSSSPVNIPLQLGSGSYKIVLLQAVSGNKYRAVSQKTLNVKDAGNSVYTNSIQMINFNTNMASIKALTEIMSEGATVVDKVTLLYTYMVTNYSYDFDKVKALANSTSYIPNIESTYSTKNGICYDFASLFAASLRANSIPTKLAMGYTPEISTYHAWNQVFYESKWNTIDITYDVAMKEAAKNTTMVKPASKYTVTKYY